jgi:hypothetical protein
MSSPPACPVCRQPDWQLTLNARTIECVHCLTHFHLKVISGYQLASLRKKLHLDPLPEEPPVWGRVRGGKPGRR